MDTAAHESVGTLSRNDILDRLIQLRALLPAFARELAETRREAARLRVENRALRAEMAELRESQPERVSALA